MHECGIRGCDEVIPSYLLMCAEHWQLVPRDLRAEVNATYRRFARQPEDQARLIDLRKVQIEAQRAATQAAA